MDIYIVNYCKKSFEHIFIILFYIRCVLIQYKAQLFRSQCNLNVSIGKHPIVFLSGRFMYPCSCLKTIKMRCQLNALMTSCQLFMIKAERRRNAFLINNGTGKDINVF